MSRINKKIRKAIFPVGGLGTRFLPATKVIPKELLPVLDKPLVQYAVDEAIEAGIEEFIFVTGRGKSAIEDYFDHSIELEKNLKDQNKDDDLKHIQEMILKPGSVSFVRQQVPAGLGHAVWCARNYIDTDFAIINADDYYGPNAFKNASKFFKTSNDQSNYGLVSYRLKNTLSKFGSVSRGICEVSNGKLISINEHLKIEKNDNIIKDH